VSAVASRPAPEDTPAGLKPALTAARAQLGLIATLLGLAAVAWWATAERMTGMDDGPGTELGALGWFLGVWLVMMAAMMFPSVSPTVALYARMARSRTRLAPFVFAAGYLATWTAAGILAYGVFELGRSLLGDQLAWDGAGRWLAGGTLVAAAAYELSPLKHVCLAKCRSPLGFLLGSWRDGSWGAFSMGARHGTWCAGCCWALMASLFALGVMSLAWMGFVAAIVALEKTVPWGRAASRAAAAALLVVGLALIAAPDALPGLVIPGQDAAMPGMDGR
jgi:predicted metal-binding membrane protein